MHPKRRKRLLLVGFLLLGSAATVTLALLGLGENANMFYPPEDVVSGKAPSGQTIRAGGMVKLGSWQRDTDSLAGSFVLTDHAGSEFKVLYNTILPDLFREQQGILVQGQLNAERQFEAREVLAKHDEKYMPPELAGMQPEAQP